MIEVIDLNKSYGDLKVLKGINLKVEEGDFYGLIGYSGAGKSTLLRTINGLEDFQSGSVLVDGQDLKNLRKTELNQLRKNIGMIFQQFNLLSQKTALENVLLPLELDGWDKRKAITRSRQLLDYVGLDSRINAYPSQLSGGEKQRVAIARALANHPKILLSDEATSALDPENSKLILELLRRINKEMKITTLMVSHEMEVIKETCNKLAILDQGEIIEEGLVKDIFANPKSPIARSFIGVEPSFEIDRNRFPGDIIRLSFPEGSYREPVIHNLIKQFDLVVNILSGDINNLTDSSVGYLILEFSGDQLSLKKSKEYLTEKKIIWEEIV